MKSHNRIQPELKLGHAAFYPFPEPILGTDELRDIITKLERREKKRKKLRRK